MKQNIFLVEVERKKTVDRVYREKLLKYERVFENFNFKQYNLNAPVKVLVIYCNLDYNCFWRPQEYELDYVKHEIQKLQKQLNYLVWSSKKLPENRYRLFAFFNFYRLEQPIWLTPAGKHVDLLNDH